MLLAARRCAALRPVARRLTVPKAAATEAPEVVADEDKYQGHRLLPDKSRSRREQERSRRSPRSKNFGPTRTSTRSSGRKAVRHSRCTTARLRAATYTPATLNKILKDFINRSRMLEVIKYAMSQDGTATACPLAQSITTNKRQKQKNKKEDGRDAAAAHTVAVTRTGPRSSPRGRREPTGVL